MTDLEDRIRFAASRVGSLNQLAAAIDVPRRTLGNWLKGTRPKPEALSAIARVAKVRLDWLMTGEGDAEEDGLLVSLSRSERSQSAALERDQAEDQAFHNGLFHALGRFASDHADVDSQFQKRHQTDTSKRPYMAVQRKIIANIKRVHAVAGINLRSDDVSLLAMDLFAELRDRVTEMSDPYEVDLVLAQLTHNLARELEEAAEKPGTGKHSA